MPVASDLAETLVARGLLPEDAAPDLDRLDEPAALRAVAEHFHCDHLEALPDEAIDPELIRALPVDYARQHLVLPIQHRGGLGLLTRDPSNLQALHDVALLIDDEPVPVLAPAAVIEAAIDNAYFQHVPETAGPAPPVDATESADAAGHADLLRSTGDAPVTKLVNGVLLQALQDGASDIHIEPFSKRLRLRYRVDGRLREQPDLPKSLEAPLCSRLKIMARLDIAEKRLPQDGVARVTVGEREIDIRVSTVPVAEGERIVLRLLRHDTSLLPLEDLGLSDQALSDFRRLLREPHGVVWVTGPTGSGKTTTLYSALAEVDTSHRNVMTIEDPVEYQLADIGQIAVKPKIGLTFAGGLRSILRQDPDIVLVGETRDLETAEIVVQASLTGHLVFSTLHTNDAVGSVVRLVDIGVDPFLVAESCRAAMAQRLVRRLVPGECEARVVTEADVAAWGDWSSPLRGETIQVAAHAEAYAGRVGLFELIVFDEELQQALRQRADRDALLGIVRRGGRRDMAADAVAKVRAGLTDPEEVAAVLGRR